MSVREDFRVFQLLLQQGTLVHYSTKVENNGVYLTRFIVEC